jgi:TatD DNase family protein
VGGVIDTHTHLNHPRLLRRLDDVLRRAAEAGVGEMIVVGYDLPSSELAVSLARERAGLYAAVGVHPHDAATADDATWAELKDLARSQQVVAIGETGLDFYRDLSPRPAQFDAFRRHLDLAQELGLPVIVHCREAPDEMLETVAAGGGADGRAVWHCFQGSREEARRALSMGLLLGFGGMLTRRGAEELRAVAAEAPGDRILLETDSPYLSPEPGRRQYNEPSNLPAIAACLADLRGVSREEMTAVADANARRLFGLGGGAGD